MTLYIIGLIVLRLLFTSIFFLGLYKLILFVHGKVKKHHSSGESHGNIILKERFASGEIDEEKYREMKSVIES